MAPVTHDAHVLIIEDDKKLARALVAGIEAEGYRVSSAHSAEDGLFLLHGRRPDVLLLDVNLPQRNGFDLLRQIRAEQIDVRVLMLTSHNTVDDRVEGLQLGADDYLGKPFSFPELLARIAALMRRILPAPTSDTLRIADLSLNTRTRTATRGERPLDLSPREYDLLLYLAENTGRTVSREMLARNVWKETSRFTPLDNVIDVQIARLRKKLDDPFSVKLLHTVRGLGFSLRERDA